MSSFRATMVAKCASATFLGIFATLLLTPAGAEEKPGTPSQPSLIVTPASSVAFSGPRGGPFSPERFEFRVSSTTGTVNYSIRTPSWLTASPTFGTTDTRGVTITQPWWRLLAGRPRRIPIGRPRWPFACAVTGAGRRLLPTDTFATL